MKNRFYLLVLTALVVWIGLALTEKLVIGQPMIPKSVGQQAVSGTASVLPTLGTGVVCLKGDPANTITIYLGLTSSVTTSTGYPLAAGESVCAQSSNLNTFYVVASGAGPTVDWIVFNNAGQ